MDIVLGILGLVRRVSGRKKSVVSSHDSSRLDSFTPFDNVDFTIPEPPEDTTAHFLHLLNNDPFASYQRPSSAIVTRQPPSIPFPVSPPLKVPKR